MFVIECIRSLLVVILTKVAKLIVSSRNCAYSMNKLCLYDSYQERKMARLPTNGSLANEVNPTLLIDK